MAKAKTAKVAPKTKAKPTKAKTTKTATKAKKAKVSVRKSGKASKGFDALLKLVEHPLVADLLAVGAMAAVAAIAESGKGKKLAGQSTKAVKNAGKAAAQAIGKRLLDEVRDIKALKS